MNLSRLCYAYLLCMFSWTPLSHSMEETFSRNVAQLALDTGSNLNTTPISNLSRSSQAATQAIDFENNLASEIVRREDFYRFTQEIASFQERTWRIVLPFIQFDSTRKLISLDGYVLPRYLSISDFARAGQPYFYSYDNEGRPFIAFLARSSYTSDGNGVYADPRIYVYYYTPPYKTWFIEGGVHDIASTEDFLMLATLINSGESKIATSAFTVSYKLVPQEELEECAQEEAESKKGH